MATTACGDAALKRKDKNSILFSSFSFSFSFPFSPLFHIRYSNSNGVTVENKHDKRNPEVESIKIIANIKASRPIAAENAKGGGDDEIGNLDEKNGASEGERRVVFGGVVAFEQLTHFEELRHGG
jgi:hypothetical protein